jgi:glutathione S-transferase
MADYKLHCFGQSGNANKVAMMLALTGQDWEPVLVDFFSGETRRPDWRAEANEMGEVPVLEHRGERLTQSGVILDYLAEVTGRFGARDAAERREIWRWILFDNHKFTSYFATHRFLATLVDKPSNPDVVAFLAGRSRAALAIVEKHLEGRDWIAADRPTIADLSLAGYMFYPVRETVIDIAAEYPAVDRWRERVAALPGWKPPYELMPWKRPPA